jgi:hypothetical protein
MRACLSWVIALGFITSLASCGDEVEPMGAGGHAGATGTGGEGAAGGGGAGGSGGDAPVVCTSQVMHHPSACPAEPCAITEDVEIACDDWEYAAPGLRVGPAPDATWLMTTSDRERFAFRVAGGEATRGDDGLPETYARQILSFALDSGGQPHLAVDVTGFDSAGHYPGGAEHAALADGAWSTSLVYDREDKGVPVIDLEIGPGDTPYVWIVSDAPGAVVLATPVDEGQWSAEPAATPDTGGGWRRFTLTASGEPVAFDFEEIVAGSAWQLRTVIAGKEASLGAVVDDWSPGGYAVTHAISPATAAPAGPPLAVAVMHDDGLHVAWPVELGFTELVVDDSERLTPSCDASWDNGCPGPCHDAASGLERDAYAIARTADGVVWVAFVRTALNLDLRFEEHCDPEPGCYCEAIVDDDQTTATLHLVRIDTAAPSVAEVLSTSIAPLQTFNLFSDLWTPVRLVDLRGHGSDLAIGVRTRTAGDPLGAAVRVLRLDTTVLAP